MTDFSIGDRLLANLDRLNALREKSVGHSVLKAAAFTIAAFDAMPALTRIAEAAYMQTHGDGGTGGYNPMLHPADTCKLCDALRALTTADSGGLPDSLVGRLGDDE